MIKLKQSINKSKIRRELKNYAHKIYKNSYKPDICEQSFMQGVDTLLSILQDK